MIFITHTFLFLHYALMYFAISFFVSYVRITSIYNTLFCTTSLTTSRMISSFTSLYILRFINAFFAYFVIYAFCMIFVRNDVNNICNVFASNSFVITSPNTIVMFYRLHIINNLCHKTMTILMSLCTIVIIHLNRQHLFHYLNILLLTFPRGHVDFHYNNM